MNTNILPLSEEELQRYNRHIMLPNFGPEAQQKLKAANVLVVGSGGLGSPLLLYLAAAGVGTIGIVDFDVVDNSNLQRQVIFSVHDIGASKAEAAKRKLLALNPHIQVIIYNTQLTSANAIDIVKNYDVVADGTDNFPTRYLINDACILLKKPLVYAAIYQFEGQVSVFNLTKKDGTTSPNYRDLYPVPPSPELAPNCAEAGVLGVLPGIIGSLQALEVIKVITGVGEPLSGRLYVFDALSFEARTFTFKHNPNNPITGLHPIITALIDYEDFCGSKVIEQSIKEITAEQLLAWQAAGKDIQLIDVREPEEYAQINIGAVLIPLAEIGKNYDKIDREKKVVLHCKSGSRSQKAIQQLETKFGFTNLYNLSGGIVSYLNKTT